MRPLFFLLTITALCSSCRKENGKAGETIEIYLLKSYQTITAKCQIDPSLSVLRDTAVVKNHEIVAYSRMDYAFKLTAAAIQKLKALSDRTPFAVAIDKQVIYYGFYKPGFSSSSCDPSITMDILWTTDYAIHLRLGYPGLLQGTTIEDSRNDPKLIATLKKQGKLQ